MITCAVEERWTATQVAEYLGGVQLTSVGVWARRQNVKRGTDKRYARIDVEAAKNRQLGKGWRSGVRGSHKERTGVDNGR